MSGGRVAWNAVTSTSDGEAHNFSRAEHLDRTTRYRRAGEFLDVVTGPGAPGARTPCWPTRAAVNSMTPQRSTTSTNKANGSTSAALTVLPHAYDDR